MSEPEKEDEQFAEYANGWLKSVADDQTKSFETVCRQFQPALRKFVENRLSPKLQNEIGASDIMQSAFVSLWKQLDSNTELEAGSTEELWRLLVTIARRRLSRHWRRIHAQKRGEGRELNASNLASDDQTARFEGLVIETTNQQLEIELNDAVAQLESELQTIVSMRLAGMTTREIANALQCSLSRIERKNRLINERLRRFMSDNSDQ
ncbi:sigma-70 family RNA polymerase sigma factor [Bremerella alba]|nr:sigma-70 family RNA polymerase sigma factor [Bremerella alba]